MAMNSYINRQIFKIALPSIISNITVPLLSLIDVAIVGHLGSPIYIGAIAVGGMLFNIIYWLFGFLRMGTSGMTSQAYGKRELKEAQQLLYQSLGIGLLIGLILLLFHSPLKEFVFNYIIHTTPEIRQSATLYFNICIWGAPATLGLYSFIGWFIGMQNTRFPMFIAITQNIVNITVSIGLVVLLKMKIEGVALGTLVAQYAGFTLAGWLWWFYYNKRQKLSIHLSIFKRTAMARFFEVNKDIFFRTVCLVSVTLFFTSAGASQGETILAVNTLLMQLFTLFSFIMDGFAYAGEALAGRYIGARNQVSLHHTIRQLFYWGIGLSLLFSLLYAIGGQHFLNLLTNEQTIIEATKTYYYWAIVIPIAGFSAFLWDGIFIGATATRPMLHAMFIASALFFIIYYAFQNEYGNHALWLAFIIYLAARGIIQTQMGRKILSKTKKV